LVPGVGLQLDPDAPHPPFSWHVALPADWAVLDTHPASWQRSLERLVDDRLAGRRLKAADRRQVLGFLGGLVADCQRAGTVISLVQIGRLSTGGVASAGLYLAWHDGSPAPASLTTVRQAVGRDGVIEEIETPAGPILLQRDHLSVAPPGSTTRVGLTSLQAFRPVPDSSWTAVVATAGAQPELVPMLRDLLIAVAGSIQRPDDASRDAWSAPPAGPPPEESSYDPVPPAQAPGIERGFGTLVVRRVNPDPHPDERPER
jgi:hypothetical protein